MSRSKTNKGTVAEFAVTHFDFTGTPVEHRMIFSTNVAKAHRKMREMALWEDGVYVGDTFVLLQGDQEVERLVMETVEDEGDDFADRQAAGAGDSLRQRAHDAFLFIFDSFAAGENEVDLEVATALESAGLITLEEVNGEYNVWQATRTYDSISREQAEAYFAEHFTA